MAGQDKPPAKLGFFRPFYNKGNRDADRQGRPSDKQIYHGYSGAREVRIHAHLTNDTSEQLSNKKNHWCPAKILTPAVIIT
jgi:hypothetical protein